jgi:hypothetical protein
MILDKKPEIKEAILKNDKFKILQSKIKRENDKLNDDNNTQLKHTFIQSKIST